MTIKIDFSSVPFFATIETDRLSMRPYDVNDFDNSAALYGDREVVELFDDGQPKSRETVTELVTTIGINRFNKGNDPYGLFTVEKKDTSEFIGHFDFLPEEDHPKEIEVGYILHKRFQKFGFGTEIGHAMVAYAKKINELKPNSIEALTATAHPDNIGSWKILEKMGMQRVNEGFRFGGHPRYWYEMKI